MIETLLRRTERDMTKNVYWCSGEVSVVLVRLERNSEFTRQTPQKKYQINQIYLKIRSVGADFFHAAEGAGGGADGQMTARQTGRS